MIKRECKSCGAPLKSIGFGKFICEYCGSLYEEEEGKIQILEICREPVQTITTEIAVPRDMRDYMAEEDISKYALKELTRQLAEGLSAYMRLKVTEDPFRSATIVRGDVRVIPPSHRF